MNFTVFQCHYNYLFNRVLWTQQSTTFNFQGHFLTELPDTNPFLKTLIYLDLSYNSFKILPKEVVSFEKLQYLKLRNNPLIQLPVQINKFFFILHAFALLKIHWFYLSFLGFNIWKVSLFLFAVSPSCQRIFAC